MTKLEIVTVYDIFSSTDCILDLLKPVRENKIKDIEYFYSKLFPYGNVKINEVFNGPPVYSLPVRNYAKPKHIEFYDQSILINSAKIFSQPE